MAGELGNVNYDGWKTAAPAVQECGRDCQCEDCAPDWQPSVLETDEDLAATEASALVNADAVESEHAVQELAWTARHYLAELTKMRDLAQRLASMHQRRCKDLGHLANTEQRELLDACRKAFPFLIASGEVKR